MSPEGAKGYVNVTVRWARATRRVFPEGAAELDLERNGSTSCNGASECRVGLREGERRAELEVEPSGGQILTCARELLPIGAHVQRDDFDSSLVLGRVGGDRDQTTAVSNRREREHGGVGRRVGSGIDTVAGRRRHDLGRPVRVVVIDHPRGSGTDYPVAT